MLLVAIFTTFATVLAVMVLFAEDDAKQDAVKAFKRKLEAGKVKVPKPNWLNVTSVLLNAHPLVSKWKQGFWSLFLSGSQLCIHLSKSATSKEEGTTAPKQLNPPNSSFQNYHANPNCEIVCMFLLDIFLINYPGLFEMCEFHAQDSAQESLHAGVISEGSTRRKAAAAADERFKEQVAMERGLIRVKKAMLKSQ
jgi:hypothetical protein